MVTACPFCGLSAHLPHEAQEACIAALHEEIVRMRAVVDRLKTLPKRTISGDDPNPETDADELG